jgi:hypothetical protein
MDDLHDMPGHLIRRGPQISTALFAEECAGFDLTAVQCAALAAIRVNPVLRRAEPAVRRVQQRLLAQLAAGHNDVTSVPLKAAHQG